MRIMNPKARITYRFEAIKSGGAGRLVRVDPEEARRGANIRSEAGFRGGAEIRNGSYACRGSEDFGVSDVPGSANGRRSGAHDSRDETNGRRGGADSRAGYPDRAADSAWAGEFGFERDLIPWRSPFQDDADALERLIRETDGQTPEESGGAIVDGGAEIHAAESGRTRPASKRETETAFVAIDSGAPAGSGGSHAQEHAAAGGGSALPVDGEDALRTGPSDMRAGSAGTPTSRLDMPTVRAVRPAGRPDMPAGRIAPRRRPPAPSWTRAIATVAGALLTGALFGWLVMSLLLWQPESPGQGEAGDRAEGEADTVLPADGSAEASAGQGPEQSGNSPDAFGGLAAVRVPAVRYYVLQYGVFSTDTGLDEALAQLRMAGYAAAADTADGLRAYAGIAESRETAEALASRFQGIELYIRPLDIPAAGPDIFSGQPDGAAALLFATNDLLRTAGGMSASLLAAGGTSPIPEEAWSDWETSYRNWKEAAGALEAGGGAGGEIGRLIEAIGEASDAFAAYNASPEPALLWNVQSALIEAAVAQRDWLRASGAL